MSYPETIQFYENDILIAQAEGSPGLSTGFNPIAYNSPITIHGRVYKILSVSAEIVEVNGTILSRMIRRADVVKADA